MVSDDSNKKMYQRHIGDPIYNHSYRDINVDSLGEGNYDDAYTFSGDDSVSDDANKNISKTQ